MVNRNIWFDEKKCAGTKIREAMRRRGKESVLPRPFWPYLENLRPRPRS